MSKEDKRALLFGIFFLGLPWWVLGLSVIGVAIDQWFGA